MNEEKGLGDKIARLFEKARTVAFLPRSLWVEEVDSIFYFVAMTQAPED